MATLNKRYSIITDVTRACLQGGDFPRRFHYKPRNERQRLSGRYGKTETEVGGVGIKVRKTLYLGLMRQCGKAGEETEGKTASSCDLLLFPVHNLLHCHYRGSSCLDSLTCTLPSCWHQPNLLLHRVIIDWLGKNTFHHGS